MKKTKKKIVFLATLCITSCIRFTTSHANIAKNINFNNITIEDGLSQSTVETIHQDSKGYIWFGTNDGLNRFNGYEFKHYKHDNYNKNSIAHNYIVDIAEDKDGYIWVATIDGLSKINPNTDEIKNYYSGKDDGNLSNTNLWQILFTKEGDLLVSTIDGLNVYDKENDSFIRILDKENELPSQYIYSVKEDSVGHIWVGTDNGLVELDKDFKIVKTYEDIIKNSEVYNTYDDLKGNLWVCTLDNGLFKIHLSDKSVINYKNSIEKDSIVSDNVKDVVTDSSGNLWVATEKGLCSFDYKTEKFTTYNKKPFERHSLIDDLIFCLFKDKSGVIWIGTYRGVSTFNPNTNFEHFKSDPFYTDITNGDVIQGLYTNNEALWVGTNGNGVKIITKQDSNILNINNSNLVDDSVYDVTGYKDKVFIGTNGGLSIITKNSNDYNITNYTEEDGLPSNKIRSLFVDSKGYLWIGTNKGLAILYPNNNLIDISYIFDDMGVTDKFIRAVYEDSKGNYYIGCFLEGGLIKINPSTKEYKIFKNIDNVENSISSNCIRYINEDLNGNILIGTSYGLNILDPNTETFKHYVEADGLINNTVYGILVDKHNNIWMSTNAGISKLSSNNKFENFTISDGLQSNEFNGRSCFKSKSGRMYFGGINGFNSFEPDDMKSPKFKPTVIFDSFEVNGANKGNINNNEFKYNENNIKVTFFSNDISSNKTTKFYYKLNGLDNKVGSTNNNSIVFANLIPGDYTLKIKGQTQHGVIGEESVVKFSIKPPFWLSNLALSIYLILIILFIFCSIHKVKVLDRLVAERTKDLKLEIEKNEALFEKVLALEKNKNNYFINLSHELRTPLNVLTSINQLIKDISTKEPCIPSEKLSYYMEMMNRNTSRLLNLINNLIDNTKIENNSYILTKTDENIVYLVEETVLDMKDYIEERGIEFIFDTDTEEKIVQCGKTEIERCIINLVGNAVKFTPKGGLIEVAIEDLDDKVKISVKDNGVGISPENQKSIFDRFNQVIDNSSEAKGGSGLGLTICNQLVSLHNGEIYVESELGKGSEFVIILPALNDFTL